MGHANDGYAKGPQVGKMPTSRKLLPALAIVSLLCAVYFVISRHDPSFIMHVLPENIQARLSWTGVGHCVDVLNDMTKGVWQQHSMTSAEKLKLKAFYRTARVEQHGMPPGLQRADGRCGNVDFLKRGGFQNGAFRALCDAEGPTPCCSNGTCVNRTQDQCVCAECLDMRSRIEAEHATWLPAQAQCRRRKLSVAEMCRLLANSTIFFMGDSLVRHLYTGFLLTVSGNDITGAQAENITKGLNDTCSGMYMFTEKICRKWLLRNVRACNGSVHLRYESHYLTAHAKSIFRDVLSLGNRSRTMAVIGLGLHESLNHRAVISKVMGPLLSRMAAMNLNWPKLLWTGVHQWGLLKSGLGYPTQSRARVMDFNKQMGSFLGRVGVPVLDTFNLTGGVMSFDGAHFGRGVNKVKADILLNYLLELQFKGQW